MRYSIPWGLAWMASLLVGTALANDPTSLPQAAPAVSVPGTKDPLTLANLEQIALQRNPTLVQAAANVDDAQGRAIQSGLYPNPTVGYVGEQMGPRNLSGLGEQQGLFIDQILVTAGKLQLNRAKFNQETVMMEWEAQAQCYRVVNGVRGRFYQLLAMQRLIAVRAELLKVAQDIVTTSEELF